MYSLIKATYPLLFPEMWTCDVTHINRKYFYFSFEFIRILMFNFLPIIINLNKEEVFFYNQLIKGEYFLVQWYICESNEMNIHLESQGEIFPVL